LVAILPPVDCHRRLEQKEMHGKYLITQATAYSIRFGFLDDVLAARSSSKIFSFKKSPTGRIVLCIGKSTKINWLATFQAWTIMLLKCNFK
jgi:hypothetical protein